MNHLSDMNAEMDYRLDGEGRFASIEAEQSVLGGLMLDNTAIDRIDTLKAEHFTRPEHQGLFRAICYMIHNGLACDVITVFEVMQRKNKLDEMGGMPYLNSLVTSLASTAHIKRYAEIVIDRFQLRQVRDGINAISQAIVQNGYSGTQAVAKAAEVLSHMEAADFSAESVGALEVAQHLLDDIARRAAGECADVIPSGFPTLDKEVLDGGFERGQLVVVAGRPSMGKTAFGFNLLSAMTVEQVGLAVSLEMSQLQLARRVVASLGSVPLPMLKSGVNQLSDEQWEGVTQGVDRFSQRKLHIQERAEPTAYSICAAARKHKRKYGLDVLLLDHLGLMDHGHSASNDATKIGQSTRALKNLALELNIVVVLLVQINRSGGMGEVKRPSLINLRDSGRIEEDADVVLLLHRDDYYRDEEHKTHDGHTLLMAAKVRDGDPSTVHLKFEGAHSRFTEWQGALPTASLSEAMQPARQRNRGMR